MPGFTTDAMEGIWTGIHTGHEVYVDALVEQQTLSTGFWINIKESCTYTIQIYYQKISYNYTL